MGYTLRVESLADASAKDTWNRIRSKSPIQTPFDSPELVVSIWQSVDSIPRAIFLEHPTRVDLALVLFERKRGPFSSAGVAPFLPFTPLVVSGRIRESDNNLGRSVWEALHSHVTKSFDEVRLHLPPGITDPRVLTWNGWSVSPLFTGIADLPSSSEISSWSKGTTQLFEKHVNEYTVFQRSEDTGSAVKLIAESYNRNARRMPLDRSALSDLVDNVLDTGLACIYFAEEKATGNASASVVMLRDGTQSYYWMAGSDKGPAMTVLIGRMMEDLAATGCTTLDFVGSNTPGIAEFKRHFNAKLIPYYSCVLRPSRALRFISAFRG